ncbi:MAG: Abi family protein [Eubacteriales bacterium]|nr:Abi family protein [Eubacteriales bacterium]
MTKPFLTYQQQIQKLIEEKHLIINDTLSAEDKLRDIGYFALIGGYKDPFRNPMTRTYLPNTMFEDIYSLYQFDNQLRELFFRYLCQIEKKMRSLISYAFCEQHGQKQNEYLSKMNYNYSKKYQKGIDKLIQILNQLAYTNSDYEYLKHQRRIYHNVPLWVLVNAMTFGQLSKMYTFYHQRQEARSVAISNM